MRVIQIRFQKWALINIESRIISIYRCSCADRSHRPSRSKDDWLFGFVDPYIWSFSAWTSLDHVLSKCSLVPANSTQLERLFRIWHFFCSRLSALYGFVFEGFKEHVRFLICLVQKGSSDSSNTRLLLCVRSLCCQSTWTRVALHMFAISMVLYMLRIGRHGKWHGNFKSRAFIVFWNVLARIGSFKTILIILILWLLDHYVFS